MYDEHVVVRRLTDNREIIIPLTDLEDTLKQGFKFVREYKFFDDIVVDSVVKDFECPLCGFIAKSEGGLKVHKRKHV